MNTALIIFAKAPVAGQAKTRLMPALGAEGSARLAQQLLMHAVQQAAQVPWAALELCVSPDTSHPAFAQAQNIARNTGYAHWDLSLQGDGDLGQRMHRALLRGLSRHTAVMLMGTDAPGLNATVLQEAAQALRIVDAFGAVFPLRTLTVVAGFLRFSNSGCAVDLRFFRCFAPSRGTAGGGSTEHLGWLGAGDADGDDRAFGLGGGVCLQAH